MRSEAHPRDSMNVSSSAFATAPAFFESEEMEMFKTVSTDDGPKPAPTVVVGHALPATGSHVLDRNDPRKVVRLQDVQYVS